MELYIYDWDKENYAHIGYCESYEQIRNARYPGWLFHMNNGTSIFLRFSEIKSFHSFGKIEITKFPQ